jgi:hypothetical protein
MGKEKQMIEQLFADQKSGRLLNERRELDRKFHEAHYLLTEMVKPLIGATITGGVVIGDGDVEPLTPVLFVEQGGKKYSVIILSDDEGNDGGRIIFDRGTAQMIPTLYKEEK